MIRVVIPRKPLHRFRRGAAIGLMLLPIIAGCAPGAREAPPAPPSFRDLGDRAGLVAREGPTLSAVAERAARLAAEARPAPSARPVPAEFLPLIHEAPEGLRFLALGPHRALAAGDPPASCPALAAGGGGTAADAARAAAGLCLARLRAAEAGDCGCRILAVDDALLAPRAAFAHASGLPVRLVRHGRLSRLRLVAVEAFDGGRPRTLILAGGRPLFVLDEDGLSELGPDGRPRGAPVPVRRRPLALDRGRILERIEAGGITLLIGFA